MLAELGIETVLDLLTTYPRRYIDRTRQADVSDLVVGDEAAVLAAVQSAHARRARTGRAVVDVVVRDETGRLLRSRSVRPLLNPQQVRIQRLPPVVHLECHLRVLLRQPFLDPSRVAHA